MTEYVLKRSVMDSNRLQKVSKKIIDECSDDRSLAKEAYGYFKRLVDENPQDSAAKAQMVDCLKLMQTSKNNLIKTIDLLVKIETSAASVKSGVAEESIFSELSKLSK
jgi:hypothetical protein